jgi:3-oxosteroid 1-dehydrogenase
MQFDHSTDVLVVGSGGGALTTALTASLLGADALVVEKTELYGGTSANSGGNVWIPNSHHTNASPYPDSREKALGYLRAAIGTTVPARDARGFRRRGARDAQVSRGALACPLRGARVLRLLPRAARWQAGGIPDSRARAGSWAASSAGDLVTLRPPHHSLVLLGRYSWTNLEGTALLTQAPGWQWTVVRIMGRYWLDIPRTAARPAQPLPDDGQRADRSSAVLAQRPQVPVWLQSPLVELIVENGRVRGAVVERAGRRMLIEARKGVVMGAGGFEHNREMRERYLPSPTSADWSASSTGNTGDAIRAGMAIGGAVSLMDHAWWIPVICAPGVERPWALFAERSSPGQVIVDQRGLRFTNEALPYLECGEAMYHAPGGTAKTIPSFIVFDADFRRKYPLGCFGPGAMFPDEKMPPGWEGTVYFKANSIAELAAKAGIDPTGLAETVRLNNEYARTGKDLEFRRGDSAYDRYYGDARVKPNPCIAPIAKPPYYAVVIRPGDTGTNGGLVTDEYARVLRDPASRSRVCTRSATRLRA